MLEYSSCLYIAQGFYEQASPKEGTRCELLCISVCLCARVCPFVSVCVCAREQHLPQKSVRGIFVNQVRRAYPGNVRWVSGIFALGIDWQRSKRMSPQPLPTMPKPLINPAYNLHCFTKTCN